jgi:hypothetical protein
MFKRRFEMDELKVEAERIAAELPNYPVGTKEHKDAIFALEKVLSLIPPEEKEDKWYDKFLSNGPLISGLFGTAWTIGVLWHERAEIITSRAFSWIRPK